MDKQKDSKVQKVPTPYSSCTCIRNHPGRTRHWGHSMLSYSLRLDRLGLGFVRRAVLGHPSAPTNGLARGLCSVAAAVKVAPERVEHSEQTKVAPIDQDVRISQECLGQRQGRRERDWMVRCRVSEGLGASYRGGYLDLSRLQGRVLPCQRLESCPRFRME